jgi:hypothetical protein
MLLSEKKVIVKNILKKRSQYNKPIHLFMINENLIYTCNV